MNMPCKHEIRPDQAESFERTSHVMRMALEMIERWREREAERLEEIHRKYRHQRMLDRLRGMGFDVDGTT